MTKSRQNVALGILNGTGGPIDVNALRSWTRANARAKDEYWQHPFIDDASLKYGKSRRWTDKEIRYLRQKRLTKVPYFKIAAALNRTTASVQAKAKELRITERKPRG